MVRSPKKQLANGQELCPATPSPVGGTQIAPTVQPACGGPPAASHDAPVPHATVPSNPLPHTSLFAYTFPSYGCLGSTASLMCFNLFLLPCILMVTVYACRGLVGGLPPDFTEYVPYSTRH